MPPAAVAALVALLSCPVRAAAQDETVSEEATGIFAERVEVNVVTVDVVVSDRDGRPVRGLTRGDFEVYEDGRPMEVTNFSAIDRGEGRRAAPAPEPEPPRVAESPGLPAERAPPPKRPEDQILRLVVFVDNVNIRGVHRKRVFQDLRSFLIERLSPEDRVMLVSYERSIKVKHGFTNDFRIVAEGLFELERLSTNSTQAEEERRLLIDRMEEARSADQMLLWMENHARSVQNDLLSTLKSLQEMVDSLAGLPGRKALLYVSDGLPMTPGEEFFVAAQASYPQQSFVIQSRSFDASSRFRQLAARANSNRVSFYTLDAAGIRVSSAVDVERKSGGAVAGFYTTLDAATVSNLHNSLKFMAEATGGKAIVNTNNFRPGLDQLAEDFEIFYSLGYRAPHSGDGRYHTIEVKVKRDGVRVQHREGYRDKPAPTRMADATLSTLRWGLEENAMGVRLEFLAQEPGGSSGEAVVPMVVRIPLSAVVLVPRGDAYEGLVHLYVAVVDSSSRVAEPRQIPVPIRVPADELERAREHSWSFKVPLRMRTGSQRVAVGVRDEIGATESFVVGVVTVGR